MFAVSVRRGAYVEVAQGQGGSQLNDQLNAALLTVAAVTSWLALVVALVVLARGRGRGALTGSGLALLCLGWVVVLVGAALVSGADTGSQAMTAAFASVTVGVGFALVALGHGLLVPGLAKPTRVGSLATAPYEGPDPYAGTPLARDPVQRLAPAADRPDIDETS